MIKEANYGEEVKFPQYKSVAMVINKKEKDQMHMTSECSYLEMEYL